MRLYTLLNHFPGAREDFDRKLGVTLAVAALVPPVVYLGVKAALGGRVETGLAILIVSLCLAGAVASYVAIRALLRPLEDVAAALKRPLAIGDTRLPTEYADLLGRIMRDAESLAQRSERAARHIQSHGVIDDLTGRYTRHAVKRRMTEDCARADRKQMTLHIALVELADAESIADAQGIGALEATVSQTSQLLAMNMRKTDWLGRWREHVFIVGFCDNHNIDDTLNRMMGKLKESAASEGGAAPTAIRAWCGAAQYLPGTGPGTVLASAVSALTAARLRASGDASLHLLARSKPDIVLTESELDFFGDDSAR
ncbi:MAG: GGDEF domain-containing protein [Betaproteobacteria bacterium]|nr:GGDEF domain-containing protein [Betaproteobacteria bacterium]